MKKSLVYGAILTLGLSLTLAACGNDTAKENDETVIKIGASNVPHAEILEFAKPLLEKEGITLDITTYNDYIVPNVALDEGDLDANYFQHRPFFDSVVAENDFDFTDEGAIHIEPLGLYSKKYESLADVKDGAIVLTSNVQSDWGRIISILAEEGLVTLKEGIEPTTATFDDIDKNTKNLKFEYENDPALMTTLYQQEEGDLVAINSNFAVDQDINPIKDSVALESTSSPYANIVAVRSEDAGNPAIKTLVKILKSKEVQEYIINEWDGAVVPVKE
ncbi:MetQ/NlpA family ABC transporter substrate-binding protein [Carnobacterium sp. TMP28]|uniref:MetQ/NlpA family ABC transporter substrate-binding protein n=1 Tax=Carnobacterium sp. TMP28 TaxID=3397060 RepID=UPI0039E1ACE5